VQPLTSEWVARHFQLGKAEGPIEFAALGQYSPHGVCRLRTELGMFAVKRLRTRPPDGALLIETSAFRSGMSMPEPMRNRDGQLLEVIDDGGRPSWIRVHRWVNGEPLAWGVAEPEISFETGRLLASLHGLPVPEGALSTEEAEEWAMPTEWQWRRLAECAAGRQLQWAGELNRKLPILARHAEFIAGFRPATEELVPSHRDLHPPNVIKTHDGTLVLIDWDSAGPVIGREDVARYALIWSKPEGELPRAAAVHAFIDGYREAGGIYVSTGLPDLLGSTVTFLKWLAFNIRRDLSDRPGHVPELTESLLASLKPIDMEDLERRARLLDY
jgi:hypothetical protein